jgi:aspartyl-tRNA(Asn)/glutamyl-tRNA(Gln) amidotransferase subunit A
MDPDLLEIANESAGLPVSLHIVGAKYEDALVLRVAHAYQAANPPTDREPS